MPFGFGKKKEEKKPAEQPAQQEMQNQQPPPPPQHGANHQGQYNQTQPQYGHPPPQQNYNQQPQYQQQQGPGVYQQQPPPPGQQYGDQPQYGNQQNYNQGQPQYGQAPPAQPPVTGTPAVKDADGKTTQTVGGHPEPVVGTPVYGDDVNCDPTVKKKFVKQGCKDVWAVVLFILQLLITIIIAVVRAHNEGVLVFGWGGSDNDDNNDNNSNTTQVPANMTVSPTPQPTEDTSAQDRSILFFCLSILFSILLGVLMTIVMRLKPVKFLWVTNIICIILYILIAIWVVVCCAAYVYAIIMLLSAAFHAFCLYISRRRIPFAGTILKQAVKSAQKNFGTFICSFVMIVMLILYLMAYSLMVIPTLHEVTQESRDSEQEGANAVAFLLLLLFLLMLFWTVQVELNIVHTTACGSMATWFYAGDERMPPAPTLASAKRALTTSFGSICFGSLLVAILQLIRFLCQVIFSRCGAFCACVVQCILGCIERLLRYFNEYAFAYVAIYGMGYIDAAKATWDMLKTSGWDALFNDWITGVGLYITALLDSILIGLIFMVASGGSLSMFFACFGVSLLVHCLLFRVASAGITTMFVCVTEDEPVLAQSNPKFYAELQIAKTGIDPEKVKNGQQA